VAFDAAPPDPPFALPPLALPPFALPPLALPPFALPPFALLLPFALPPLVLPVGLQTFAPVAPPLPGIPPCGVAGSAQLQLSSLPHAERAADAATPVATFPRSNRNSRRLVRLSFAMLLWPLCNRSLTAFPNDD
jgi:hypothetical protein